MSKTAIVTGASGFLGSHLAKRLVGEGWSVHTTSRHERSDLQRDYLHHAVDLSCMSSANDLLSKVRPQLIVHLAGSVSADPSLDLLVPTFRSHVVSAVNLISLLGKAHFERLVLTGSLTEASDDALSSPYAVAKKSVGLYAKTMRELHELPIVSVRPFMTYGPKQSISKVIPYVITSLLSGDRPQLSSGSWTADWIYVDDVVNGIFRAATRSPLPEFDIDLGSGSLVSLKEVLSLVATIMGQQDSLDFGAKRDRPLENVRVADVDATQKAIDWIPRISLKEGLSRTIDYYRHEYELSH